MVQYPVATVGMSYNTHSANARSKYNDSKRKIKNKEREKYKSLQHRTNNMIRKTAQP